MSISLKVDSGQRIDGEDALSSGVSVFLPERAGAHGAPCKAALVCLAGGNMNRRYFDLQAADDPSFSFAHAMTSRGFAVVTIDHIGLGDSSKPKNSYAITHELLTRANAHVTADVLRQLREGRLRGDIAPMPTVPSIGVGHSMGAMMTVLQQAAEKQHVAIAPLGFSTRGLPEYMPKDALALSQSEHRAQLPALARKLFVEDYPVIRSSGNGEQIYGSANADRRGITALKAATDCLLPVTAYLSMLPNNVGPEAAQIDVPVFLGLGERDLAGSTHQIPAAFPRSRDVTLYIQPDAGHSHFLFPTRSDLFARFAAWAEWVASQI
ncbi:MAG TPA: alpha/beta fold hydrolase [Nevskiaceae bacterium]|nr:alpha/beta fold hydrolase [Nevskiaceae bacterium]